MSTSRTYERVPTRISPDMLDTIGATFAQKHGKGIAEWLKNSLDNYLRLRADSKESLGGGWPVLINMVDGKNSSSGPNLVLIDFGGTDFKSVERFLLNWGDRSAATHGKTSVAQVTGGHGNGGKFYMRQMWNGGARFATWRGSRYTSLVVERTTDGSSGFWEAKDQSSDWLSALSSTLSEIESGQEAGWIVDFLKHHWPQLLQELNEGRRGFTCIVGRQAVQKLSSNDVVKNGKWNQQKLIDEIHDTPQARRPLRELTISLFVNNELKHLKLSPPSIVEDPDWKVESIDVVSSDVMGAEDGSDVLVGTLTIRKSVIALSGRHKDQNSLYIVDGTGNPIATYPIRELPFAGHSTLLSFVHADMELDFEGLDELIQNDRERLTNSNQTEHILTFVAEHILRRAEQLETEEKESRRRQDLDLAKALNQALNEHASRFLQALTSQMLVDFVEEPDGGGIGDYGEGEAPSGKGKSGDGGRTRGTGGATGVGGTKQIEGTSEKIRQNSPPRVLLSELDPDPASQSGLSKSLTSRHPPLYQDEVDLQHNVWWINTVHPFAEVALNEYGGAKGVAFRNFQLSMFRDVVQREAIRSLRRRDRELDLDRLEGELDEVSHKFLAELPVDLIESLLRS